MRDAKNEGYSRPAISSELGSRPIETAADRSLFSRGLHSASLSEISGVPVATLAERFGTPLFVYDENTIREQAKRLRTAMTSRYPRVEFAWSFKTNYLDAICQVLRSEGWGAEVVSQFEYQKARHLGYDGSEIIFNGPYKPREALKRAIAEGALIQIDNWDEMAVLEELSEEASRPVRAGIRAWMDTGIKPVWSRFGFALETGEAERAAARILKNPRFSLEALHAHIGTYILSPAAYGTAARKLIALREELDAKYGHLVDCINLGGGFPSLSLLHGMPGPPEQTIPPIENYAEEITSVLRKLPDDRQPLLRFETGRYLVDEAGYLLTRIVAVRGSAIAATDPSDLGALALKEQMLSADSAQLSYVLDAGINLLYTAAWFQIEALPEFPSGAPPVPARLIGPLCMALDIVRERVDLPPLSSGDLLTLHPVGAYNQSQSMQFIRFRPAAVLISPDGQVEVIREGEHLEDIEHNERVPPHLLEPT